MFCKSRASEVEFPRRFRCCCWWGHPGSSGWLHPISWREQKRIKRRNIAEIKKQNKPFSYLSRAPVEPRGGDRGWRRRVCKCQTTSDSGVHRPSGSASSTTVRRRVQKDRGNNCLKVWAPGCPLTVTIDAISANQVTNDATRIINTIRTIYTTSRYIQLMMANSTDKVDRKYL